MKGWTPQAIEKARKAPNLTQERTNARHPTKDTDTPQEGHKSNEKEPTEKHVQLPPAPAVVGPWAVGHWTVSRATTYEPRARVVLTGPAAEFEKLLAHLQAFKP